MKEIAWVLTAFLCGALPLSLWLGKLALGVDIRHYGDGNPGAANVWRAGGKWWGFLAILLDAFKGLVPVALAHFGAGLEGWPLVFVCLGPIYGHAFSPFLGFHGGKSLSVTFGVWAGLTLYEVPMVLGLSFAFWIWVLKVEGWAILAGMLTLLAYLAFSRADWTWWAVWAGSLLVFLYRHWTDFKRRPKLIQH